MTPRRLVSQIWSLIRRPVLAALPNLKGINEFPPGHFYSPLLDLKQLRPGDPGLPFDGEQHWANIDLRKEEQRTFYTDLFHRFPATPFPKRKTDGLRYHSDNGWFNGADALVLSGVIRQAAPRRIIEVGSGFSTAVTLDTLDQTAHSAELTFIEPNPARLEPLLTARDRDTATLLVRDVREIETAVFAQLGANDILFIDSSHVAKVGSDVTDILLRILPCLQPGVLIHFHDIFHPYAYPVSWLHEGRAWNESLFLRAFLLGNPAFEIFAFNAFAAHAFPEVFRTSAPLFLAEPGCSLWIKKIA